MEGYDHHCKLLLAVSTYIIYELTTAMVGIKRILNCTIINQFLNNTSLLSSLGLSYPLYQ